MEKFLTSAITFVGCLVVHYAIKCPRSTDLICAFQLGAFVKYLLILRTEIFYDVDIPVTRKTLQRFSPLEGVMSVLAIYEPHDYICWLVAVIFL